MSRSMFNFRQLCSMIQSPHVRNLFEEWAIKNIQTYQVEARISGDAEEAKMMKHFQDKTLAALIGGIVEGANVLEHREWLQGDVSFGTIITRQIKIIGQPPQSERGTKERE